MTARPGDVEFMIAHSNPAAITFGDFAASTGSNRMNINPRIYTMTFSSVYPHYVAKAQRKGRTKAEVDQIIRWLTGYTQRGLEGQIEKKVTFDTFFSEAPRLNPLRSLITGVICGVRVEEITEPLMREMRYMDKLIDELAKGKPMQKILRSDPAAEPPTAGRRVARRDVPRRRPASDLRDSQARQPRRSAQTDTQAYNQKLPPADRAICDLLAREIDRQLPDAENKVWHGHPVWFLEGNPIVGFSRQKPGIRLMFWSGADFDEPGLNVVGGRFKDASVFYNDVSAIKTPDLQRWLRKAREIQWDYKNIVRRKGRLVRLK